jgi:hypothetical protein
LAQIVRMPTSVALRRQRAKGGWRTPRDRE